MFGELLQNDKLLRYSDTFFLCRARMFSASTPRENATAKPTYSFGMKISKLSVIKIRLTSINIDSAKILIDG